MENNSSKPDLARRRLLLAAGLAPGAVATGASANSHKPHPGISSAGELAAKPNPDMQAGGVAGLHLQFGGDASNEVVVSWHSLEPVGNPRVLLGKPDGRLERLVSPDVV